MGVNTVELHMRGRELGMLPVGPRGLVLLMSADIEANPKGMCSKFRCDCFLDIQ